MHQVARAVTATIVDGLLTRSEDEVRAERRRHAPADHASREHVDDKGTVDDAPPRRDGGEVRDPSLSGPGRHDVTVDEVNRTIRTAVRLRGGHPRTASDSPTEAHRSHQAAHRTARHAVARASQLPPDLARAIYLLVVVPDALNLPAPLVVALDPCAPSRGICVAGLVPDVRRRGHRHDGADRLDPVGVAMVIDALTHHRGRRASSACATYADAVRTIALMRFSSRTSCSNSFARWRSAVVRPPRSP